MRRFLKFLLIAVAVLVLVAAVAVVVLLQRVPRDDVEGLTAGDLEVGAEAVGEYQADDDVTLTVAADRIEIRADGRVLWSSSPGRSFVAAGSGDVEVQEHRGYFWPTTSIEEEYADQTLDHVSVTSEGAVVIQGQVGGSDYGVTIRAAGEGASLVVAAPDADVVALIGHRTEGAGVHGLGAQFAPFDLDGRVIPILVREQGVGRGEQPLTVLADLTNRGAGGTEEMTYAAWASWVTDDLQGVRLDPSDPNSHAFATLDLTDPDTVALTSWTPTISATLTAAEDPAALVAAQQAVATREELPEWSQTGAIVGLQGGTESVRADVKALQEAGVPIAGVWLQDWSGRRTTDFGDRLWWTWQLDAERYPGWDRLVQDLRADGIATTTYVNPFLVDAGPKGDASIRNLYAEARDRDFLVRNAAGDPYPLDQGGFDAYLVDLTNPAAADWYAEVIATEVLTDGVAGFMADFAEGLPFDAELAEGDAALLHNQWPALWQQTVRDACELAERSDCLAWFRSGALTNTSPVSWVGDQMVDFSREDGLSSALQGMLSAGVSGWPLAHSDIGGYTSINAVVKKYRRTPELLARWAELQAFGVLMRTHEGNLPDVNAQVVDSDSTRVDFARMTKVYAALAPYRATVIDEAVRTGVPAMRHGWLAAPDTDAALVEEQFFLGADVLVSPVLEEGATAVDVTLPPGEWRHLFTGETYDGDQVHTVQAPVGTPAAFVRADSVWSDELVEAVSAIG